MHHVPATSSVAIAIGTPASRAASRAFASSPRPSTETATTDAPAASSTGRWRASSFSASTEGGAQLAQNSTTAGRPARPTSARSCPSRSRSAKSGAGNGW
jgi:hypothetical protein